MLNERVLCAGSSWPGCAPAGGDVGMCARRRSNFLLRRQKKVTKEKASRIRRPAAPVRCVARSRRGAQKLALRAQTSAPLIRLALRYSPPHYGGGGVQNNQHQYNKYAPRRVLVGLGIRYWSSGSAVLTELSSAGANGSKSARCLSPQGEFARFPFVPSSARNRAAALSAAALSFGDFSLGTQRKVTALSGALPDSHPPQQANAC